MAFIGAIAAAAVVIPVDGQAPGLAAAGVGVYLVGLALHAVLGRQGAPRN
jgi:hypothetical protein